MITAGRPTRATERLARRVDRRRLELAISVARQRVQRESPFSPSWDAAMAALEELERTAWHMEERAAPER
jgi:hypothetical protein